MNKKVSIEIAVGIIILIALFLGGYIWLSIPKENSFNKTKPLSNSVPLQKTQEEKNTNKMQEEQNKIDNEIMKNAKAECEKKSGKECGIVMCEGPDCRADEHGWQPIP